MAAADRFVILHSMVNDHPRGSVVPKEAFAVPGPKDTDKPIDTTERLLSLGAIRPAEKGEAALDRVDLTLWGTPPAAQAKLAQLDSDIEQLQKAQASLNERLNFYKTTPPPAPAPPAAEVPEDPAIEAAIKAKEEQVKALKEQVEATSKQATELAQAAAAASEAPDKPAAKHATHTTHATHGGHKASDK